MAATQLHVIVYDISDDKIRNKLHKCLCRYGTWTQFSLFECFLTAKQRAQLIADIQRLIEKDGHVRIYTLSADDVEKTITIGGKPPKEAEVFIL